MVETHSLVNFLEDGDFRAVFSCSFIWVTWYLGVVCYVDVLLLASLRPSLAVPNDAVSPQYIPFAVCLLTFTFLLAFLGKLLALHTQIFLHQARMVGAEWVSLGSLIVLSVYEAESK